MMRKLAAGFSALLLILPMAQTPVMASVKNSEKDVRRAQRVKDGIVKIGVGPEAQVRLKLKNKTTLVGHVSKVGDEYFEVTELGTGQVRVVGYPDVTQVQGHNLSTRTKIIIAAGVIAGVIITLYLVRGAFCDGC